MVKNYTHNKKNINIEWIIGNRLNNIYSNNFDVVIYCGQLPQGDFYAKHISKWTKVICASQEYIDNNGLPKTPNDLINHSCLDHSENYKSTWTLDKEYNIKLSHKCSSTSLLAQMAVNSLGICYLTSFAVDDLIAKGSLVRILSLYTSAEYDTYLVSKSPLSENKRDREIMKLLQDK